MAAVSAVSRLSGSVGGADFDSVFMDAVLVKTATAFLPFLDESSADLRMRIEPDTSFQNYGVFTPAGDFSGFSVKR